MQLGAPAFSAPSRVTDSDQSPFREIQSAITAAFPTAIAASLFYAGRHRRPTGTNRYATKYIDLPQHSWISMSSRACIMPTNASHWTISGAPYSSISTSSKDCSHALTGNPP